MVVISSIDNIEASLSPGIEIQSDDIQHPVLEYGVGFRIRRSFGALIHFVPRKADLHLIQDTPQLSPGDFNTLGFS